MKGADNNGRCYFVKEIPYKIADQLENVFPPDDWRANERTIEKMDEKRYYDDPVLTFEDAMLYGCTLELNEEELKDFCEYSKWQHLMIF